MRDIFYIFGLAILAWFGFMIAYPVETSNKTIQIVNSFKVVIQANTN